MIFNPELECASRERLEEVQTEALTVLASRVYERVPFSRETFEASGVRPGDVRHIRDIVKLPLTTKDDLRADYPFGLFAVPLDRVLEVHASSGTAGKAVRVIDNRKL